MNDIQDEYLSHDDFDSFDLLTAVDELDNMRYILADKDDIKPPQSRQNLMELHEMVFEALNYKGHHDIEKMLELLDDVRTDVEEIQNNAEYIVEKLTELERALYKNED